MTNSEYTTTFKLKRTMIFICFSWYGMIFGCSQLSFAMSLAMNSSPKTWLTHHGPVPWARVDPFEPNRVWWTVRGNGTHTGQAVPGRGNGGDQVDQVNQSKKIRSLVCLLMFFSCGSHSNWVFYTSDSVNGIWKFIECDMHHFPSPCLGLSGSSTLNYFQACEGRIHSRLIEQIKPAHHDTFNLSFGIEWKLWSRTLNLLKTRKIGRISSETRSVLTAVIFSITGSDAELVFGDPTGIQFENPPQACSRILRQGLVEDLHILGDHLHPFTCCLTLRGWDCSLIQPVVEYTLRFGSTSESWVGYCVFGFLLLLTHGCDSKV